MPRAALVLVVILVAACGGEPDEPSTQLASGSYVGAVPGTRLYVAVVAAEPAAGQDQRAIRMYVCDGRQANVWLSGRGGERFSIRSEDGRSRAEATVSRGAARGSLELADGRRVDFRAERATGIAGLYDSALFPDGRVRGSSETGVRLEGRRRGPARPDGRFRATGTYRLPRGETRPWSTLSSVRAPSRGVVESRIIVLPDGSRRGGFKGRVVRVFPNSQPQ
jgi:hypothetical protein